MANPMRMLFLALCAWTILVLAMLVVSRGSPAAHDWLMVLAIGAAASIALLLGSWRNKRRT